jgi:hypothetical protein
VTVVATVVDWVFRDRRTGRIVVAQWPNPPLAVWLGATAVRVLVDPAGTAGTVVQVVGTAALGWWAVAEVGWGVNPWRRFLGAVVLAGTVASALG